MFHWSVFVSQFTEHQDIAAHVPLVSYLCHSSLNINIHHCTCIMGPLFVSQFIEHQKILLYFVLVNALWVSYLCPGSLSIKPHCYILCLYTHYEVSYLCSSSLSMKPHCHILCLYTHYGSDDSCHNSLIQINQDSNQCIFHPCIHSLGWLCFYTQSSHAHILYVAINNYSYTA